MVPACVLEENPDRKNMFEQASSQSFNTLGNTQWHVLLHLSPLYLGY